MNYIIAFFILIFCAFGSHSLVNASEPNSNYEPRSEIRFYKINKDGITQKILFNKRKARKPGCHNFMKRVRLHRTVQIAFKRCQVFSEKECASESVVLFHKKKEPDLHSNTLTQGYGWYPVGEHPRGEKVKSWLCE